MPIKPLRNVYIFWHKCTSWWWYGDYKFPRIINIEVATHCNRSCTYCPNIVHPEKARLIKEEVLDKVLFRLKELKWKGIVDFIFFNEPTLHPNLAGIVKRVKEAAPYSIPRISTNGDMLTTERIKSYVDAGMDRIYVMRHNPTPAGWVEKMARLKKEFPGVVQLMDIDEQEKVHGLHDFNGLVEVKNHRPREIVDGRARCKVHRHVCQITVDGEWDLCCVGPNNNFDRNRSSNCHCDYGQSKKEQMKIKLLLALALLLPAVIQAASQTEAIAAKQGQQNLLPSWMDGISISPEFAVRYKKIADGDAVTGAGLDIGLPINKYVSLHVEALAYSEEESWKITKDDKDGRLVTRHDDGWGGSAIDESSLLIRANLFRYEETLRLYAVAGPSRDWVADDWGLGAGLGIEYRFGKNVAVGPDFRLRYWDKQPRDGLLTTKLSINF